MNASVKLLLLV